MVRIQTLESPGKSIGPGKSLEMSRNFKVVVLEILLPAGSPSSPLYDLLIIRPQHVSSKESILFGILQ